MRDAMTTLRETGGELIYNYALSLLAESYLTGLEPERGLAAVTEAFKEIDSSGQHMLNPSARILKGLGGSNPPLSAKLSAIPAFSAEKRKIVRMLAHFLRPEGTGEA